MNTATNQGTGCAPAEAPAAPEVWSDAVAPGGYVCGAPSPGLPGDICGQPVEDEPCKTHNPDWRPE